MFWSKVFAVIFLEKSQRIISTIFRFLILIFDDQSQNLLHKKRIIIQAVRFFQFLYKKYNAVATIKYGKIIK